MLTTERNTFRGADQRAHARRPSSRKVYLVSGRLVVKCTLVDVAEGGARIRLTGVALPAGDLYLVDPRARRIHFTKSVWQSEREVGLQFIESGELAAGVGGESAVTEALVFADKLSRGLLASKVADKTLV